MEDAAFMRKYHSVILGAFLAGLTSQASENPYKIILERNAFRLSTPPTNAPVAPPLPVEPPPNIKFTGITAWGSERRAYFIQTGTKPGSTPEFLDLQEGQRRGTLEVVQILTETGEVKIINSGKEMLLSFKEHGNKPSQGPLPIPGGQPVPGVPQIMPTQRGAPNSAGFSAPAGTFSTIASTQPVSGMNNTHGGTSAPLQNYNPIPNAPTATEGGRNLPRAMRIPSGTAGGAAGFPNNLPANPQPQVTDPRVVEEQLIHHEIQREIHKNNPDFPPLPSVSE